MALHEEAQGTHHRYISKRCAAINF